MNNALPHVAGGLLNDAITATLGDTSKNVVNSYSFSNDKPSQSATIAGRNQATGAQIAITNTGDVTQVSGSTPPFNSVVVTGPKTVAAPTGRNVVSVDVSIKAATGVPSLTVTTDNAPPQTKVCPTVPTPVSVNCPPGFEPTNGPPLVSTEPGGCGGDNRYWYSAGAPSTPVLPAGAVEIQRISYGANNYLLAQGETGMPPGIGCAWQYGGVTTFGCREIAPRFSSDGRLDPSSGSVATASGGCGGGNREWYRNEAECPLGSQQIESVDFAGNNYKLCESEFPQAPGVGCGWKYGNLLTSCETFDGCTFGVNFDVSYLSAYAATPELTDLSIGNLVELTTQWVGPPQPGSRACATVLNYNCSPSKPNVTSITLRLDNVVTTGTANNSPMNGAVYLVLRQDGNYWWAAPPRTFSTVGGNLVSTYNGLFTLLENGFQRATEIIDPPVGQPVNPDFSRAFVVGLAFGRLEGDYFTLAPRPLHTLRMGPGSEVKFNYNP